MTTLITESNATYPADGSIAVPAGTDTRVNASAVVRAFVQALANRTSFNKRRHEELDALAAKKDRDNTFNGSLFAGLFQGGVLKSIAQAQVGTYLTVGSNATVVGTATIGGAATIGGNVAVTGDYTSSNGDLTLTNGNLTVSNGTVRATNALIVDNIARLVSDDWRYQSARSRSIVVPGSRAKLAPGQVFTETTGAIQGSSGGGSACFPLDLPHEATLTSVNVMYSGNVTIVGYRDEYNFSTSGHNALSLGAGVAGTAGTGYPARAVTTYTPSANKIHYKGTDEMRIMVYLGSASAYVWAVKVNFTQGTVRAF